MTMANDVFPARAGMNRSPKARRPARCCVPRTRGDEPENNLQLRHLIECSLGISHQTGRSFRSIPAGCFARFRPVVSEHSGPPLQGLSR